MIDINFTEAAIEYIKQELNNWSEVVLTISRKPKSSCFPIFTGNIIRLENKEDFNTYIENYIKVEETKYKPEFEIYIEKRLLLEEGNKYTSTIDVQKFEEDGEVYGNLIEEVILFSK